MREAASGSIIRRIAEVLLTEIEEPPTSMVGELASNQPEEPVTEWLAGLEPVLGPAAELGAGVSAEAIAPAAEQAPVTSVAATGPAPELQVQLQVVRVAERAQCLRTAAAEETVSEIGVSRPTQGSVQVATLLAAVGLTEAPLDRPVVAEVPAWEAVDSAVVAAAAGDAAAAAGEDVAGNRLKTDEITSL